MNIEPKITLDELQAFDLSVEELEDCCIHFDPEEYKRKMAELDAEIIRLSNLKVWYNPKLYTPTDREKAYIVYEGVIK